MEQEIWKEYGDTGYMISNWGNVKNKKGKPIKPFIKKSKKNGYEYISIKDKDIRLGRLVATLFVPNPDPEHLDTCDHIDGNKYNNHADNLQWLSRSDNVKKEWEFKRKQQAIDYHTKFNGFEIGDLAVVAGILHNNYITPDQLTELVNNLGLAVEIVNKENTRIMEEALERWIKDEPSNLK